MKKLIITLIAVAVILIIVLNVQPKDKDTINIGIAAALSGYAANWGEGEVAAISLAYDEVKDSLPMKVNFIVENTKSDGLGTVQAVKKLIEIDKTPVIIGPTWADSFQGAFPIAEKAKVVLVTPSGAMEAVENSAAFSYFFSTWWPQEAEANVLIGHMQAQKVKTVVTFHDADAFNTAFMQLFTKRYAERDQGVKLIDVQVPIGTKDFRTEIAKLKKLNPDAIINLAQDTGSTGTFAKQAKELGLDIPIYSTTSTQNPENVAQYPDQFNGVLYSYPDYENGPAFAALAERLAAAGKSDLLKSPSFVNAYNAAKLVFAALQEGNKTGEEMRDALMNQKVPGIGVAELRFNQLHQLGDIKFKMKTILDNEFVDVK